MIKASCRNLTMKTPKTTKPKSSIAGSIAAAEARTLKPEEIKEAMENNQIDPNASAKPAADNPAKPKEDKKPKRQRVEQILVRHEFTVPEIAELGKTLADKSRVLADMEAEAKACARQYKDKIATMQTEIDSTVAKVKEGFEMIPVSAIVMVQIDRRNKTATKAFYRKDTGAYIKSEEILSNTELELFNVLPEKRDLTKPLEPKLLETQV